MVNIKKDKLKWLKEKYFWLGYIIGITMCALLNMLWQG